MAGYIGSKSSVTLVDGYTEAEANAEFVNDPNGTITVSSSNVGIGTSSPNAPLHVQASTSAEFSLWGGAGSYGRSKFNLQSVDDGTSTGKFQITTESSVPSNPELLTITNSGNVGIGTSSPSDTLDIERATGVVSLGLQSRNSGDTVINFGDNNDGNVGSINYAHNIDSMLFTTNASVRMRIDSSGNLLVGRTSNNWTTVAGFTVQSNGAIIASRADASGFFNRLSTDGAIVNFAKNGTTVGIIGVSGGSIRVGSGDTGLYFDAGSDRVIPINPSTGGSRDGAIDLGGGPERFDDIYATNGTIQTSDFNEKQDIATLTATEMLVGKRISALFKTFRWKDSVAEKGDNARTHTGVIAQDVQAAFTAEGLDAGDYALFISSTWWETQTEVPAVEAVTEVTDEDGNVITEAVEAVDAYTRTDTYDTEAEAPEGATERTRMGIRYPELLSFVAAYNEQRFASIEARLTALEA